MKKNLLTLICIIILGMCFMDESVIAAESESILDAETASVTEMIDEPEIETKVLGNGVFEIEITGMDSVLDIKNIYVPVWQSGDQMDIFWYIADKQEDGKYKVEGNIENHQYHIGTYKVHVYVETHNGNMNHILSSNVTIPGMSTGDFYEIKNEYSRTLVLEDVESQGIAQKIYFAVWGNANGQNDMYWYEASEDGDTYSADVMYFNHNEMGTYSVHVYVLGKDGSMTHIKSISFQVDELPKEKIEVVSTDGTNGQVSVKFYLNRSEMDISKVYLAAWSKSDQSDIYWYEAVRQTDGSYLVATDLRQHDYHLGRYIMHGYVQKSNGDMELVDSTSHSINMTKGVFSDSLNSEGYSTRLTLSDAQTQGIAKKVYFAVWSEANGQDDIIWYEANTDGNTYFTDVMFYNHKDPGTYHAHIYISGKDGEMNLLQAETFLVNNLPEDTVEVVRTNDVQGTFDVKIYMNRPESSIRTVYLAAWSKSNQSDICWYTAVRQSDGSYLVNGALSNHNYNTGNYHMHAYVKDTNGNMELIDTTSCMMKFSVGDFYVAEEHMEYSKKLVLSDVYAQGAASKVYFAVWSEANGQDDICWYEAFESGMNYICDVLLYNHKDVGIYYAHAYLQDRSGQMNFLKSMVFEFDLAEMPKENVVVSNVNENEGTFDVSVYLFRSEDAVKQVYVPVWTKPDQSDINWYVAERQSNGSYYVKVNAMKHQWNSGQYKIHSYVETPDGKMNYLKSTSAQMALGTKIVTQSLDEYSSKIKIYGADARARKVYFPIWSVIEGQDDVIWYEGTKNEDASWSTVVHTKDHVDAGDFICDIYVDVNGSLKGAGRAEFNIAEKWEGRLIDPNKPMVALTFDDGPSSYTPRVLNCLEENGQVATFFVVGYNAARYGQL